MTQEQGERLAVGEIVQINPEMDINPMFGACLLVVTELKSWGVMGYVQGLGSDGKIGGQAYIRLPFDQIEKTNGMAVWAIGDEPEG
jgi:hypothetical protein